MSKILKTIFWIKLLFFLSYSWSITRQVISDIRFSRSRALARNSLARKTLARKSLARNSSARKSLARNSLARIHLPENH